MRPPQRRFIVHIEDDEDDQAMLKEAVKLTDPLLEVLTAGNGQRGLEVLLQCVSVKELPGLILLDLNMPGLDGKAVLLEVKKQAVLASVPLVVLTTSSSELDKFFAANHGVPLYTKPSSEAEFFGVVKNILKSINW
jgi:DNA-binding response OmpR family regulator